MATRLYGVRDTITVTPSSWSAGWNKTTGAVDSRLSAFVGSDQPGRGTNAIAASGTSGHFTAVHREISPPLAAQTISGTFKGQRRCNEAATGDNFTLAVAIKVIQSDGTDRGVLLAVSASDNTSATPPEMATSGTNRRCLDSSESASLTLSSVDASAGDRIVIEWGFRQASTSTNNGTISWGSDVISDLPEDDTDTGVKNNWGEFSGTIAWESGIEHYGSRATPEDAASEINEPVTSAVTPPTGMLAGDLVLLWGQLQVASANASITQSELGGQSWTEVSLTAQGNDQSVNLYFCTFDGTWDANPSIAFAAQSGTQPATAGMHVFRPPNTTDTWELDQAGAFSTFAAPSSPFTVTRAGQTTVNDNTVTLACWFSGDDNSWTSLSGTGWAVTGTEQYRNTAGSDQSASFAHYISASASTATGDVSKNQTTVTGDAGITIVATFNVVSADKSVTAVSGAIRYQGQTPTVFTLLPRDVAAVSGEIRYTGQTPTVFTENLVDVAAVSGAITYAGQTPAVAVTANTFIDAVSGAIVYAGQTPTVARTENHAIDAVSGAIVYSGQTPTVSLANDVSINAFSGSIVYAGQTVTLAVTENVFIDAASGAILYAGQTPTVARTENQAIAAVSGSIVYAGQTPTVDTDTGADVAIDAVSGTIRYSGQTATLAVTENVFIDAATGTVTYAGQTPTVERTANHNITAVSGTIVYTGQTATIGRTENQWINAQSGSIIYVGQTPIVTSDESATIDAVSGAIVYSGQVPTVDAGPQPAATDVKTGTGGIDPGRRRIIKPTGLLDRPVKRAPTVEERIAETREIAEEIRQVPSELPLEVPPIALMTQEQIDAEIGLYLRELMVKAERTDDETLLMLIMMSM